jgi:hypothetical protein
VAAVALLVVLAVAAPEHREAPRSGEFAAAGRQPSRAVPGAAAAARPASFSLRFAVAGPDRHLTGVRVHSRIPCGDGPAIDDRVSLPAPPDGALAARRAFTVETGGIRLHGFFISPDRATGTLMRTVGRCAIAGAQWTARLAG